MDTKKQHYIDLIMVLLHKDLKVRYKRAILGYIWSIGHPLAYAVVFYVAFKIFIRIDVEDYALFLISGLFPWQWFSNSVQVSPTIFLSNWSIIKKIRFPHDLLPLTAVLQDMVHYLLSIPVIVLFLFIYGKHPSWSWVIGIPILSSIQFLLTYGVCLIISSTNLFIRDLERLTTIALTLVFYFTPIIYPENMIPAKLKPLLLLNPMTSLVVNWRNLLIQGTFDFTHVMISVGYSILSIAFGYYVYRRLSWRFAEVL